MSERDKNDERARISERAADWYIRLRDEHLSVIDRKSYVQWLKQSPAHVAEMLRMEQLHGVLKQDLPGDPQRVKH